MKLLYAIQGTGNGHLARAIELAPYLSETCEIDFLISGKSVDLKFPYPYKLKYHGIYFIFGDNGGINYKKTIKTLKPFRFIRDILQCPVKQYDAIINDFEPVSAWASKIKSCNTIAISHQSAFYSKNVPRPKKTSKFFEFGMKNFAPYKNHVSTHYKKYDDNIFLPLIRRELLNKESKTGDKILVYLPAYSDELLISFFKKIPSEQWQIFSKKTNNYYRSGNIEVNPINRELYSASLINAKSVVIASGFQGTSEALYLGKKMMTIPMYDQYEQLCNAAALKELGVCLVEKIEENFEHNLRDWLEMKNECSYSFKPEPQAMAKRILSLI